MAGIGRYNYAAFPIAEKHRWFRSGPGAGAAVQVGDGLRRIAARFDVSDATIGQGFVERRLGSGWRGGAADAASGAFNRAAGELAVLAGSSGAGGGSADDFADSFTATKNAIPAPPPAIGENSWTGEIADDLGDGLRDTIGRDLGVQSDYRARLVANRNAELAANDALARHEAAARDALARYQDSGAGSTPPGTPAAGDARDGSGAGSGSGPAGSGPAGSGPAGGGPAGGGPAGVTAPGAAAPGAPGDAQPATPHRPHPTGDAHRPHPAGNGDSPGPGTAGTGDAATSAAGYRPPVERPGADGWVPVRPSGGPGPADIPPPGYLPTPPARQPSWRDGGGGYRSGPDGRAQPGPAAPPSPRTGTPPPPATPAVGSTGAGSRSAAGQPGMGPMGMGTGARSGAERQHRNQHYLPSDEPFQVEYDFHVSPAVLGVPDDGRG